MPAESRSPTIIQTLAVLVAFSAALLGALVPVAPGNIELEEGDIAFRTVRAPQEISFVSETLTEERRQEAADAVVESTIYDPSVAIAQQTAIEDALQRIQAVRADTGLTAAARIAELARIANLNLSQTSAQALLDLSPERFSAVSAESRRALASVLDVSLASSSLVETRERASSFVDPAFDRTTATLVAELIRPFIVPNLTVDTERTAAARAQAAAGVTPVRVTFAQGQAIVQEDTPVTAEAREALVVAGLVSEGFQVDLFGAGGVLAVLSAGLVVLAARAFRPDLFSQPRLLLATTLALAVPVLAMKLYLPLILPDDERHYLAYLMPLAAASMVLCALLGAELALVVAATVAMLTAFAAVYLSHLTIVGLAGVVDVVRLVLTAGLGAAAGVLFVRNADRFSRFLLGGFIVSLTVMAALCATWLIDPNRDVTDFYWMLAASAANGGMSAFLSVGIVVTLGSLFGVTTRVQLLEMSQLSQPLLRRLQDEAPSTFQHSVIVANLAEKGAYIIGADALLARVGCYYHDIGKLMRPGFFIENQLGGENPHDALEPADSARIIAEHVLDGSALAHQYKLPAKVAAFVPEHHGTRHIAYFYRRAAEEDPTVSPDDFRYPGPKPQSRETAIAMLADSCEAAVRASPDHTPERIDAIVDEVYQERLAEGELDESDLTLRNLRALNQSFKETLRAVYHPRIEYPAPTEAELLVRRGLRPRLIDRGH
jgi:putative nucleotidyltransferase with HDIG domain